MKSAIARLGRVLTLAGTLVTLGCSAGTFDSPEGHYSHSAVAACLENQHLNARVLDLQPPELPVVEIVEDGATSVDLLFASSYDEARDFAIGESGETEIRGNVLVRWYGSEGRHIRSAVRECLSKRASQEAASRL